MADLMLILLALMFSVCWFPGIYFGSVVVFAGYITLPASYRKSYIMIRTTLCASTLMTGIVANSQTIRDKKVIPGNEINACFDRFGIIHEKFGIRLTVSTKEISVSEKGKQAKLFWTDTATVKGPNMDLQVIKGRSLTVTLRNSELGFYTLDSHPFFKQRPQPAW